VAAQLRELADQLPEDQRYCAADAGRDVVTGTPAPAAPAARGHSVTRPVPVRAQASTSIIAWTATHRPNRPPPTVATS
jgi:hypothetical protein